jgi:DNA-binding transcriptional LysR family regulator
LTRAVRKLEEELGGLLLRREHLLTRLTDFGRLVRPHLEQMTFSIGPSQWSTTRQFGTVVTALVRDLAQRYWLLSLGVLAIDGISIPFIPAPTRGSGQCSTDISFG